MSKQEQDYIISEVSKIMDDRINKLEEFYRDHKHTGVDSQRINGNELQGAPREKTTDVSTLTAGATYTGNEQALINNLKVVLSETVLKLKELGFIKQ